ncbi:hypothetical protein C8Q76DRAFT_630288 [Earliella scabrosa]|nr:hypothetical protein C8Q76DRAFT_630288 [Earliella scabrosa]
MRTPSPTPSEARVLSEKTRICDWKLIYARMRHPRPYMTRRNIWIFVVVVCIIAFFAAFLATQKKIVHALRPFADWMRETPAGWVLPIALMFVLSFPPLFGHEIVAILCGTVYGIWIGFGIVAAGTFLGELGNFYAFRWCCQARGRKFEETRLKYALYAQVVREGGLRVPTIMRFSAIPGHFSTAVFSTCGMSVWMFCASAFLSLPKQLAVVYVGVSEEDSGCEYISERTLRYCSGHALTSLLPDPTLARTPHPHPHPAPAPAPAPAPVLLLPCHSARGQWGAPERATASRPSSSSSRW